MKKVFTKVLVATLLLVGFFTVANAQKQLWPIATDSVSVKASQFADSSSIFWSRTGNLTPPTGFKGWVTKGIASGDPAKKDSARWEWRLDANPLRGAYSAGLRRIGSPTTLNGAAVFDSDFYDTKGSTATPGTGQAPRAQVSELISPVFDATGSTNMYVQFHQFFRRFTNTTTKIHYSTDAGVTWSTGIEFNPQTEIAVNSSTLNPVVATNTDSTLKRVVLKGAVGTDKFQIKFVFEANYYFWIIDDVKVMDYKFFDMKVTNFYAIPTNVYTPKDQLEPMRFLADVRNDGLSDMKNVKLVVKVWRAADRALMFADTTAAGQYPSVIKADTAYENRILPKTFTTSGLNTGLYVGSYRVVGDSSIVDLDTRNDTARFVFVVSDTTDALSVVVSGVGKHNHTKEDVNVSTTRVSDAYWTATEPKSWRLGNFYRIVKGQGNTITSLICRINAFAAAGRSIAGTIYEWTDANNDATVQATERTLVAASEINIPATVANGNAWYLFRPVDILTNKLFTPKNNTNYLAMFEFDAPAPAATPVYIQAVFNGNFDYRANEYLTDSLNAPRYNMIMGKTTDSDWSTGSFASSTLIPCVRINIAPIITNTVDILSDDNKLSIFPNPASSDFVNLQFDFVKPLDAVLSIFSMDGRFMAEQNLYKLDKQTVRLEIKDYSAGIYMAQIMTAEGTMTKRFVVAK